MALTELGAYRTAGFRACCSALQPCRAASIAAMSIFFIPIIASKARFASSRLRPSPGASFRGAMAGELQGVSYSAKAGFVQSGLRDGEASPAKGMGE
jgi:hypothetical protein